MSYFNTKNLQLALAALLAAYIILAVIMHNIGITKGYKYINHVREYSLIQRFGKIIVRANVISIDEPTFNFCTKFEPLI